MECKRVEGSLLEFVVVGDQPLEPLNFTKLGAWGPLAKQGNNGARSAVTENFYRAY